MAAVIPSLYALTRFTWLVYPLGFDREVWESARADGSLLAGVWLGAFAIAGAVLTLGLTMRWGEVFPRWIPRLAGRPVPVRLAVVPASLVALMVLPAGNSMILHVLSQEHGPAEPASNWGAVGPTFLWPLWGVALGAAALAYYLRRRPSEAVSGVAARPTRPVVRSATATR